MRVFSSGLLGRALLLAGLTGGGAFGRTMPASGAAPPEVRGQAGEQRPAAAAAPYVDHRQRTLEVPPDSAPAPLISATPDTPLAVLWFGPSDPRDPVTGDLWQAAWMAFNEANADRATPWVVLRPCWSRNPWGTGVARLFQRVYHEPVVAILGSVDGAATHLAEQVVAKAQLPLVSPVSNDASVNFAGVPWMFSCAPPDDAFVALLAQVAERERQERRGPLVLVNATDHDSRQTAQALRRALSARRAVPRQQLEFTPGGDTFEVQLRALADVDPAVLLLIAGAEDSARFLRGLRRRDLRPRVLGAPTMGRRIFRERAGSAAEGVRFPFLIATAPSRRAALRRFQDAFRARAGHLPDYAAVQTYDAARLLIEAIRRGGSDRRAVRQALFELSPWPGLGGEIAFDGLGRNQRPVFRLATIRDGAVRVLPREEATSTNRPVPIFGLPASSAVSREPPLVRPASAP